MLRDANASVEHIQIFGGDRVGAASSNEIDAVDVSPSGRYLLLLNPDDLRLVDLHSGKERFITDEAGWDTAVFVDDQTVWFNTHDGVLRWSMADGAVRSPGGDLNEYLEENDLSLQQMARGPDRVAMLCHDGDYHPVLLFVRFDGTVVAQERIQPPKKKNIRRASDGAIAFSPDGAVLIAVNELLNRSQTGRPDVMVTCWNQEGTQRYAVQARLHDNNDSAWLPAAPFAIRFSPDGTRFLLNSTRTFLFESDTGTLTAAWDTPDEIQADYTAGAATFFDDTHLLVAGDVGLMVWDLEAEEATFARVDRARSVHCRGPICVGEVIAIVAGPEVVLLHRETMEPLFQGAGHRTAITALCFSPDETRFASQENGKTCLWAVADGALLASHDGAGALCFHPDHHSLFIGALEMDLASGALQSTTAADARVFAAGALHEARSDGDTVMLNDGSALELPNAERIQFAADGALLLVHTPGRWQLLPRPDGTVIASGAITSVTGAAMSASGRFLAQTSADFDGVRVQRLGEGLVGTFAEPFGPLGAVAVHGETMACAEGGRCVLHDLVTGRRLRKLTLERLAGYAVTALAFSPSGAQLLIGYDNGMIVRWAIDETPPAAGAALPLSDDLTVALAPWRQRHTRTAWRPKIGKAGRSWFGGAPQAPEGFAWPRCVSCHQPMRFLLQLDCASLPPGSPGRGDGTVLFFCCDAAEGCETWEAFSGTHAVTVVSGELRTLPLPDGVEAFEKALVSGWEAFSDLPSPSEHERLGLFLAYDFDGDRVAVRSADPPVWLEGLPMDGIAEQISEAAGGDKLGGWPSWVQHAEYPACPLCSARLRVIMQIDSEDNVDIMFGDVGTGHISQCPHHPAVLTFGWACS